MRAIRSYADQMKSRFILLGEGRLVPSEFTGKLRRRLRRGRNHVEVGAIEEHKYALPQTQQQTLYRSFRPRVENDFRPVEMLAVVVGQSVGIDWPFDHDQMVRALPELIQQRLVEKAQVVWGEDAPVGVFSGVIIQQFGAAEKGLRWKLHFRQYRLALGSLRVHTKPGIWTH